MEKPASGIPQGALIDQAYEILKEGILSKQYSRNQKLVYGDLENMLGMSKTPIVAALDRLVQEGYVRHRKNYGYYITDTNGPAHQGESGIAALRGLSTTESLVHPAGGHRFEGSYVSQNEATYEGLRKLILARDLAPGQKLIYSDLEEMLGVSKTPILNALARLQGIGLVYLKPNAGYYVKPIDFSEIIHLFEARRALELANTPFIISNCTDNDILMLEEVHQQYENYSLPLLDNARLQINNRFHLLIARMGRNTFMFKYILEIYDWIELRMPLTFEFLPPKRLKEIPREHEQIIEAIRARDKNRLESALKKHLKAPVKDIAEYLNMKPPLGTVSGRREGDR
ncbi:MAG: GntR family transcriptional regulator [Syntrophobacteraceae bacterium]|jgi:DNA-binding GntR family transcriptional regulator